MEVNKGTDLIHSILSPGVPIGVGHGSHVHCRLKGQRSTTTLGRPTVEVEIRPQNGPSVSSVPLPLTRRYEFSQHRIPGPFRPTLPRTVFLKGSTILLLWTGPLWPSLCKTRSWHWDRIVILVKIYLPCVNTSVDFKGVEMTVSGGYRNRHDDPNLKRWNRYFPERWYRIRGVVFYLLIFWHGTDDVIPRQRHETLIFYHEFQPQSFLKNSDP